MQSIRENILKIKPLLDDVLAEWGILAIIILLGLVSFGLGRLSAVEDVRPPVSIREAPAAAQPKAMYMGGLIEASRSGNFYYYPWCAGAAKITSGNQVWFASEEAAKRAGYAAAKNCKGLVQ